MENTFSTSEFIEIELTMMPVAPGTKGTPRPADRPRRIVVDDDTKPVDGQAVKPPVSRESERPPNPTPD